MTSSITINEITVPPVVRITEGYLAGLDAPVVAVEPATIVTNQNGIGVDASAVRITIHAWHPVSGKEIERSYYVARYNGKLISHFLAAADERFPLEVCEA